MPHADPIKRKEYYREWKKRNCEKVQKDQREYQAAHRDRINAKHREWRSRNYEKTLEASRNDYRRHKEKRLAAHKRYRKEHQAAINEWLKGWRKTSKTHQQWKERTKEKRRNDSKKYRKVSNPKYRDYLRRNREKLNEQARQWKATSPLHREWVNNNKEKRRIYVLQRYHQHTKHEVYKEFQRLYNVGRPTRRMAIFIKWEKCNKLCYICGRELEREEVGIDHVHPVVKGGTNDIDNLMPVHRLCNNKKKDHPDYPSVRPDLVELCKGMTAAPRQKERTGGIAASRARVRQKVKNRNREKVA